MNGPFHLYDAATGLFTGQTFHTNDADPVAAAAFAKANTPDGHAVYVGDVADHSVQKVDITTGLVVDYQPPQPSADHEWNAESKRWHLSAAIQAKQQASAAALSTIGQLEANGVRSMRELALGVAGAQDRLTAIDAAIAVQRALL